MAAPGAFDDAVRGVAAVAHVASIIWNDGAGSADAVIAPVVAGAVGVLEAAAKEPGVKRVVYTSSSLAAYTPAVRGDDVDYGGVGGGAATGAGGGGREVSAATWNEETVRAARVELGPGDARNVAAVTRRALDLYGASKAEAERAVWRWVEEREGKVGFEVNAVLPNVNFGRSVDPVNQGYPSTIGWPMMLATGTMPEMLWDAIRPRELFC